MVKEASEKIYGRLEMLGVMGGNDPIILIEDGYQDAYLAKRNSLQQQKALPLSNDGVHHEIEDSWRYWIALCHPPPSLEGTPVATGGLADKGVFPQKC